MSRDAIASVYTIMLNDDGYREVVASEPDVLDEWDLTDEERLLLQEEAGAEVIGFAIGSGPVMGYLGSPGNGRPLSQPVGSALGTALNRAAGLPVRSLGGLGFAMEGGCCPWNAPPPPSLGGMVE
jgi:hypothetical protein